jgi:hypothetical protein
MAVCGLAAAAATAAAATKPTDDGLPDTPLARAVAFNLIQPDVASVAVIDSLLRAEQGLPTAARIGTWARRYAAAPGTAYRFGLAAGGYVDRGLLVPGLVHDCISLVYRVSELARVQTARHAIELALATRFAGADPDAVIDQTGRVDYDHPAHLDYSLDMIRSGHWGQDITTAFAGAERDTLGSARYAPGSFHYLPARVLAGADLHEGDLLWLVLNPADVAANRLRQEHGPVIGHAGIVIRRDGAVWMVHAASRPLSPWYERAGVVAVPLAEYLRRVDRYDAVVVTRFAP